MDIKSSFIFNHVQFYECQIQNQDIPVNVQIKPTGKHYAGKSNNDVNEVYIINGTCTKVPQGLTKVFPNMRVLSICTPTMKNLSKDDLAEYKNMEELNFMGCGIDFLPGDLFEGLKNLQSIDFAENKLRIIEPNILDGLENLKYVDFVDNVNYNIRFSALPEDMPEGSLEEIKNHLFEKFFASVPKFIKTFVAKMQKSCQIVQKYKSNSLYSDLEKHIQNDDMKDFTVKIEGQEFCVHKSILSIRSPTLARMLQDNPDAKNLKIFDIPVDVFKLIVDFFYTDQLPNESGTNYCQVFGAACKLEIEKLRDLAVDKIMKDVNAENAIEMLEIAIKSGHNGLRQKAFGEIKKNYPKIKFKEECEEDVEKLKKLIGFLKKMEVMEREISDIMI